MSHTCTDSNCKKFFVVIPQELRFYEEKGLPLPMLCPSCRHAQRMALRSERQLYRRKCDLTGKDILSVYPPKAPYKVYSPEVFWDNVC